MNINFHRVLRRKKNIPLITGGFVVMAIGLFGIIAPFLSFRYSEDYRLLERLAEQQVEAYSVSQSYLSEDNAPMLDEEISQSPSFDPNRPSIEDRLVIPSAEIDMALFDGIDADVLLKGGWVFPSSVAPNPNSGNTVIFGHRFKYLPPVNNTFYSLDKVAVGDKMSLAWNNRVLVYEVIETKIVEPEDLSSIRQTEEAHLTLITCAPLFSTSQRLVVTAKFVSEQSF